MNGLDIFLILLLLAYAVSGYWQGFITGAFATAGLLAGGFFGIWLAPQVLGDASPSIWVSLGALFIVLLSASFGQALMQFVGSRIRARITWQPVRALDAVGGAALSVVAVLVVTWALGVAVSGARLPWVSQEVRGSTVLRHVNDVMPPRAVGALDSFNDVVGASFFPRYLEPFQTERIVNVGPPPAKIASDPRGQGGRAERGQDPRREQLRRGRRGQRLPLRAGPGDDQRARRRRGRRPPGWSPSPARWTPRSSTTTPRSTSRCSRSRGSACRTCRSTGAARAGDPGAVLGYPGDGPYDVEGARIRAEQRLRSQDIYGDGAVIRDVYSVRAMIRPGQLRRATGVPRRRGSRGGLRGVGDDSSTGYVLTADQVAEAAAQGLSSPDPVSSGRCA